MQVLVHYQGMDHSPWMDQFIQSRVAKLGRFLHSSANVHVYLKMINKRYVTSLAIHYPHHDYAFTSEGINFWESFSVAIDKAARSLSEQKKRVKDQINRKFFSIEASD